MPDSTPIDIYLNDHLAGATGAVQLAEHLSARHGGSELGKFLDRLVGEIKADKSTLEDIMTRVGVATSPIKQAGSRIMEKLAQLKMSVSARGQEETGTLIALETLSLGVEGKASLWRALQEVADGQPPLKSVDFDCLISRAGDQRAALEEHRLSAARVALLADVHI